MFFKSVSSLEHDPVAKNVVSHLDLEGLNSLAMTSIYFLSIAAPVLQKIVQMGFNEPLSAAYNSSFSLQSWVPSSLPLLQHDDCSSKNIEQEIVRLEQNMVGMQMAMKIITLAPKVEERRLNFNSALIILKEVNHYLQNHYDILEISHDASDGEIRASYLRLAKKHHPDKSKAQGAAEKFALITEAFKVLNNPQLRQQLDDDIQEKTNESKTPKLLCM